MPKSTPDLILNITSDTNKLNNSQGYFPYTVSCIKAIRMITMCGLKEAKDGWDAMREGKALHINIFNENKAQVEDAIHNLKVWGISVVKASSPREAVVIELKRCANELLDANDCQGAIEIINTIRRLIGD